MTPLVKSEAIPRELFSQDIGTLAASALRDEAWAGPKPGLVDRFDSGAHTDMDLETFYRSAEVLEGYFQGMYERGFESRLESLAPKAAFVAARKIGLQAESAMFEATGGVNTHKGAIFSLGLVATAAGYRNAQRLSPSWRSRNAPEPREILHCAAEMVRGIVSRELAVPLTEKKQRPLTAGEKLYYHYGVSGIRGEAEAGFPAVLTVSLPLLQSLRQYGIIDLDSIAQHLLLHLILVVEDSTVLSRGGYPALRHLRIWAAEALRRGGVLSREGRRFIEAMNRDCNDRGISCGGSADLLALSLFLDRLLAAI